MAGRIIVILGLPRSGTSAVAGIVTKLGIPTGPSINTDNANPQGYFEDREFVALHRQVLNNVDRWPSPLYFANPSQQWQQAYRNLFERRNRQPVWALKELRLPWVWPYFQKLAGDDIAIIRTHRPYQEIITSALKVWDLPKVDLVRQATKWDGWLTWLIDSSNAPLLELDFNAILTRPIEAMRQIAKFTGQMPTIAAARHITTTDTIMAKVKAKLRTFTIRETFIDPYVSITRSANEQVQEQDLLDAGWQQADIERAVGSLLTPHLWPTKKQQEEVTDDG